jgi:DNA-binding transcriptional ArsR family regulator
MNSPTSHRARATTATLAQVKALADPLRYRVFENLLTEPRTAKQMAEHLGTHPMRLYHHFRVLERAGLIRPAGTRQKRGTTEKYFKAVIDRVESPPSTSGATPLAASLLEGVLGSTLADIQRAVARSAGARAGLAAGPFVKRYRIRATPAHAAEIQARLDALAGMCEAVSAPEDAQEFGLTLAFYPVAGPRRRRKSR